MNLTDEQKEIIQYSKILKPNEILSIQACAGSGKTSTLKQIALANPDKTFLYLAFNKAIVEESKTKFPSNVDIKTLHSLAYNYTTRKLGKISIERNLNVYDVQNFLNTDIEKAIALFQYYNNFLKSGNSLQSLNGANNRLGYVILELYNATLERLLPITHSFYLKYYQLAKDKRLDSKYDFILLDEAQDTNNVMLSVFLDNNCRKIFVGDSFQNIYGFNESINAFDIVKSTYQSTLSQSFRCKQEVLDYAGFFLNELSDKNFKRMTSGLPYEKPIEKRAYITRTNVGIINFIDNIKPNDEKNYYLAKEPNKIFAPIFAIMNYIIKKYDLILSEYKYITNFESMEKLLEYVNKAKEVELLFALVFLKDRNFAKVWELKKKADRLYKNNFANNIITNAHQSKGLEWDSVTLLDDFCNLFEFVEKIKEEPDEYKRERLAFFLEQELHLFYVAITRAKYELIDYTDNYISFTSKNNPKTLNNIVRIGEKMKTKQKINFVSLTTETYHINLNKGERR